MSDTFSIAFIVPAAGRGQRLGAPINKVLMPVGNRPLLAHTLSALAAAAAELAPVQTIIVIGAGDVTAVRETVLPTVPGSERLGPLIVVPGGSSRQASVLCGLEAAGDAEWVLVHDGARPLVTPALILETVAAAVDAGAAAAAAPLVDTIKRVDAAGFIQATVPREGLWAVETPQVFRRTELIEAHRQAIHEGWLVTDDAALMERLDRSVKVVPAYENNLKVTGPRDLDQIRRTLAPADSGDAVMRVGYAMMCMLFPISQSGG
ncbi:MAG: 2-C-methyl-D-erythritol 4-phosphate cytidylyltransferase [Thermaerobacterales bacterium]